MPSRRCIVSLLVVTSVLWTALWPLVTGMQASMAGETPKLCHQAGSMVSPDSVPMQGDPQGPAKGKRHCPLCIMAFFAVHTKTPTVAPFLPSALAHRLDAWSAPQPTDLQLPEPNSRAPPVSLAA